MISTPPLPALVVGEVAHERRSPLRHRFSHPAYQWLVDLDDPPRTPRALRPFARFRAGDHLDPDRDHHGDHDADGTAGIRARLERLLAARGEPLPPGSRVLMLANAVVAGYVFDPLTVFWCLRADGGLHCLVAEVHNTYGERAAYLLHPDESGAVETEKTFYVSPFNDVSGTYRMRFVLRPDAVAVSIRLDRDGMAPFHASFTGTPYPATTGRLLRAVIRMPLMPQRARALITVHGVWLWLRRLPVRPRPPHPAPPPNRPHPRSTHTASQEVQR